MVHQQVDMDGHTLHLFTGRTGDRGRVFLDLHGGDCMFERSERWFRPVQRAPSAMSRSSRDCCLDRNEGA